MADVRDRMILAIETELNHAYQKHGREPWGRHEFYAILREEVDELWDDVKHDAPIESLLAEVVQVAAVCFRYAETGSPRGPHPTIPLRRTAPPQAGEGGE